MSFIPFELERWQNAWEHRVKYNLAESGVHPLSLAELLKLTQTDIQALLGLRLGYTQTNGTEALRAAIASQYPRATSENVLVTVGSAEANFVVCWTLISPGDHVTIQIPAYAQAWGLAKNFSADVTTFRIRRAPQWSIDPEVIRKAVRPGTRLVVVTNPNNPTGYVLSPEARETLVETTRRHGTWLLADEVYRGAERVGDVTPTLYGATPQTIVTGGLSKAYGLPGLRLGWIVAPTSFIDAVSERHDYTVIGPSAISDLLAVRALASQDALLGRTRNILTETYGTLDRWFHQQGELFDWEAPTAGAVCFPRYKLKVSALQVVTHLRERHDILVVPGDHFDTPQHLRFGFGIPNDDLEAALEATARGLVELGAS